MSPGTWKNIGILCFIACPILLYFAWHYYQQQDAQLWLQQDASERAEDQGRGSSREGNNSPGTDVEEYRTGAKNAAKAMKYSLCFAALTGIGGVVATVMGRRAALKPPSPTTPSNP